MLQTRLENEQFDSLPNIRSQNGFISTDRPDSSQRVDLHIYIIPKSVWRNIQHLAQNEAMDDAISVGFVRVSPDMNLYDLRQSIEKLCRTENYFPRDFIFLRSVGRCLTRVKSAQEEELKVKNYRPPQTLAPEIYLLEGRHEDYAYIVSASPALSSASYLFGNRYQRRSHVNDYGRPLSRYSHRRPLYTEKFNSPARNTNDFKPHLPSTERKKWAGGGTQIDSDFDDSLSSTKDLFKLREEQERLRQRQAELERMRRDAEEKKAQSERGKSQQKRRQEEDERLRQRQAELEQMRKDAEEKKAQLEREKNQEKLRQEEDERLRQRQAELERKRKDTEEKKAQSEREKSQKQRRQEEEVPSEVVEHEHRPQEKTQSVDKEDERLRQRQAESERMRRNAEEKKAQLEREKSQRQRRQEEKAESERLENERRRQEKAQAEREAEARHQRRRQGKLDAEQRRLKQEAAATNIQASFRGFKVRQAFRERQRKDIKNDSRISSSITNTTIKNSITNEKKPYINDDDELSDGSEILSRSSSIGSTSDDDSNSSRTETRTIKTEDRESINSNSSSSSIESERKIQSNLSSYSKTEDYLSMKNNIDDKDLRTATVTKIRHPEEELLHVSTPDIYDDDTYELERRGAEDKRRQKSEGEKPKIKELEERRRRESTTSQQNGDLEPLVIRLQKLRTDRADLEKVRHDAIKHLKSIHNRITLRRKEARDIWKKKYFREKKITAPLEQHVTESSTNLDKIHKKILQIIDNECQHQVQMGNSKEAEAGNFILQTTRVEHEIQDVRRQVDQAKLRLSTDVKLRNQAENECRVLKQELNQAKTNFNQIKNRTEI